jgi:hypothetical protein
VFLVFSAIFNWLIAAGALTGFIAYKLLARWDLRHRWEATRLDPACTLLLRVFGFERRTQRLLEELGLRWRHLGPIRLIAGTDLR